MLTALDLADIRSVDNAADMIHNNRPRFADLPNLIRNGIQSIAIAAPSPYATAMIPRGEITVTPRATRSASVEPRITSAASPVAELAAARYLDAVEVAMESPPALTKFEPPLVAAPAPALPPMILASADPAPLQLPPITPVSLPMSAAIPLDMVPLPRPAPGAPSCFTSMEKPTPRPNAASPTRSISRRAANR